MNKEKIATFIYLNNIFRENGFDLFFVGGTVRDYLLGIELTDLDVVTNAKPSDMKLFLEKGDYSFEKYGSVKLKINGYKFDITTLRKENGYSDYRHPSDIVFCDSLEEDVKRRDFTINALYMDKELKVIDFVGGQKDLNDKIIKIIGDPDQRIKEDPLRILRAIRFMVEFNFSLDEDLLHSMQNNGALLEKLNKEKVSMEIKKCSKPQEMIDMLKYLNILCYNI